MVNELRKDLSLRVGAGRTRQGFLVAGLDGLAVLGSERWIQIQGQRYYLKRS